MSKTGQHYPLCRQNYHSLSSKCNTFLTFDKTKKMACAPSEDSDQPGHLPSLIRVFTVRSMGS